MLRTAQCRQREKQQAQKINDCAGCFHVVWECGVPAFVADLTAHGAQHILHIARHTSYIAHRIHVTNHTHALTRRSAQDGVGRDLGRSGQILLWTRSVRAQILDPIWSSSGHILHESLTATARRPRPAREGAFKVIFRCRPIHHSSEQPPPPPESAPRLNQHVWKSSGNFWPPGSVFSIVGSLGGSNHSKNAPPDRLVRVTAAVLRVTVAVVDDADRRRSHFYRCFFYKVRRRERTFSTFNVPPGRRGGAEPRRRGLANPADPLPPPPPRDVHPVHRNLSLGDMLGRPLPTGLGWIMGVSGRACCVLMPLMPLMPGTWPRFPGGAGGIPGGVQGGEPVVDRKICARSLQKNSLLIGFRKYAGRATRSSWNGGYGGLCVTWPGWCMHGTTGATRQTAGPQPANQRTRSNRPDSIGTLRDVHRPRQVLPGHARRGLPLNLYETRGLWAFPDRTQGNVGLRALDFGGPEHNANATFRIQNPNSHIPISKLQNHHLLIANPGFQIPNSKWRLNAWPGRGAHARARARGPPCQPSQLLREKQWRFLTHRNRREELLISKETFKRAFPSKSSPAQPVPPHRPATRQAQNLFGLGGGGGSAPPGPLAAQLDLAADEHVRRGARPKKLFGQLDGTGTVGWNRDSWMHQGQLDGTGTIGWDRGSFGGNLRREYFHPSTSPPRTKGGCVLRSGFERARTVHVRLRVHREEHNIASGEVQQEDPETCALTDHIFCGRHEPESAPALLNLDLSLRLYRVYGKGI
eukprot:gene19093-biopygen6957